MRGGDVKRLQRYLTEAGHRTGARRRVRPADGALAARHRARARAGRERRGHPPRAARDQARRGRAHHRRRRGLHGSAAGGQEGQAGRQGPGHERGLRRPSGLRPARREAGGGRGQRDRHRALQVGRRPRPVARRRATTARAPCRTRCTAPACSTDRSISGDFARWQEKGEGRWITIYANRDHVYMVVAGMRFDTSAQSRTGSRWTLEGRSAAGFTATHPANLVAAVSGSGAERPTQVGVPVRASLSTPRPAPPPRRRTGSFDREPASFPPRPRRGLSARALVFAGVLLAALAAAAVASADALAQNVIVRFEQGATAAERADAREDAGAELRGEPAAARPSARGARPGAEPPPRWPIASSARTT